MGKGNRNIIIALVLCMFTGACEKENFEGSDVGNPEEGDLGTLVFDFELPERRVPVDKIHRIDLSIAKDPESLYKGYFITSANVSDLVRTYAFNLAEGEYYYQAGITCSSEGDTCLWDGFPGGQFGAKWTAGKIEVVKKESIVKVLKFLD